MDRLEQALACAAVGPGLRSVLVFDPRPGQLPDVTALLADFVAEATDEHVDVSWLAGALDDDGLWLTSRPRRHDDVLTVAAEPGILALTGPRIVVVPDLATLELSAARGLVAVVDAEVAHLERHNITRRWRPAAWYLAACARRDAGRVSPHLLDRFALRVDGGGPTAGGDRLAALRRWVDGSAPTSHTRSTERQRLRAAAARTPRLDPTAAKRVLHYLSTPASPRRDLALARCAVALARLTGDAPADADDVDRAADLIGLTPPASAPDAGAFESPAGETVTEADTDEEALRGLADAGSSAVSVVDAVAAGEPEVLAAAGLAEPPPAPYPEDDAIADHEFNPLSEGAARRSSRAVPRGTIIGSAPTTTAHDLAVLATIMAAAPWQPYRRAHGAESFKILPTDLRRHRRAPHADRLLAIVLDHTCLAGWEWGDLLFPFFRWAYVERAEVCLVQVGAAGARADTRAERLLCRNLLDPRLDAALSAGAGSATPLAHGLQLALETLRHKLQHVLGTRLVVLTDGRGNVPLDLDPELRPRDATVGRLGVEDALAVARSLGALARVERVVLDCEPTLHRHLLENLAAAMRAELRRRKAEAVRA